MTAANASGTAARWKPFLRAFAQQVDHAVEAPVRDAWLRRAGAQMAHDLVLPQVATLDVLADSVNEILGHLGWGHATFSLDAALRVLTIVHTDLPRLGALEEPGSPWLSAFFEGVYTAWLGQLSESDGRLFARRSASSQPDGSVAFVYGRAERLFPAGACFTGTVTEASGRGGAARAPDGERDATAGGDRP